MWFLWNHTSCQWGWEFMNHLKTCLDKEVSLSLLPFDDVFATLPEKIAASLEEQEEVLEPYRRGVCQFFLEGRFIIEPIVKRSNLQRTREDHLKIWKLIELATREYIHGELV
jgi:hypothetical protein